MTALVPFVFKGDLGIRIIHEQKVLEPPTITSLVYKISVNLEYKQYPMSPEEKFNALVDAEVERDHVELGKLMSAPGIRYKNKNYAFFHNQTMCFKLGKEFPIENYEVSEWAHLSPFKTKPPLKAWYILTKDCLLYTSPSPRDRG